MKTITSAEFRKTYPRITEATTVTANGHVIGHWLPPTDQVSTDELVMAEWAVSGEPIVYHRSSGAQVQRDAILRKINKGG